MKSLFILSAPNNNLKKSDKKSKEFVEFKDGKELKIEGLEKASFAIFKPSIFPSSIFLGSSGTISLKFKIVVI